MIFNLFILHADFFINYLSLISMYKKFLYSQTIKNKNKVYVLMV